jgi:hypothetical protein
MQAEDGRKFLDQIINNNAATYATELDAWSLEYIDAALSLPRSWPEESAADLQSWRLMRRGSA